MIEGIMTVTHTGLIPEANEFEGLKIGESVRCKVTRMSPRNAQFFRKWWSLVKFAYENWEPGEVHDDRLGTIQPQKSFDRFRKDLTILAGHYHADIRLDGSTRIEAKSISWGKMTEDQFADLYSKTIDVILQRVLTHYTREDLDDVVSKILGYA